MWRLLGKDALLVRRRLNTAPSPDTHSPRRGPRFVCLPPSAFYLLPSATPALPPQFRKHVR